MSPEWMFCATSQDFVSFILFVSVVKNIELANAQCQMLKGLHIFQANTIEKSASKTPKISSQQKTQQKKQFSN